MCVLSAVSAVSVVASVAAVRLELPEGWLEGSQEVSELGNTFYSFYGVPYALPPTGARRFLRPEPVFSWGDSVLGGNIVECAQEETGSENMFSWGTRLRGTEDCLVVNIYTPQVGVGDYPVMVFFHGGGYFAGQNLPASISYHLTVSRIRVTRYLWARVLHGPSGHSCHSQLQTGATWILKSRG